MKKNDKAEAFKLLGIAPESIFERWSSLDFLICASVPFGRILEL